MHTPTLSGGLARFTAAPEVQKTLRVIDDEIAVINEELSYVSDEYDGSVVFSHTPGDTVAFPVGHSNAHNVDPFRRRFRDTAILRRAVLLPHTSLKQVLDNPRHPRFSQSNINDDGTQLLYTLPLAHNGERVGAIQQSFSAVKPGGAIENLPEEQTLLDIFSRNQTGIEAIAAQTARLQNLSEGYGTLGAALEYDEPIAPNAFIARWDIEGSKGLTIGERSRALKAFLNQAHFSIRALARSRMDQYSTTQYSIEHVYDDQGDGANIILPIPERFNTYDRHVLRDYRHYTGEPFLDSLRATLDNISEDYKHDLMPRVRVDGIFGYVEPNSIGRFTATQMFTLGGQKAK